MSEVEEEKEGEEMEVNEEIHHHVALIHIDYI